MNGRKNAPEGEDRWWQKAVFYQIYPRSYKDSDGDGVGDIRGIIEKLDYLNDGTENSLGVDAIWLSPFSPSPDCDFGYDVADYCAIDYRYGTMDDFKNLLGEAHGRGIKVFLDLVVNHTSDQHSWFRESRSSGNNRYRDWYIWHDGRKGGIIPPNNWRNNFFGSAWTYDQHSSQYYLHSFLCQQPDLNWKNTEVLEAVKKVISFWLEMGADGFRLDVPHVYCKDPLFRNNPPFYKWERVNEGPKFYDRTLWANVMKLLSLPELQVRKYNQHQPGTHQILKAFRRTFDSYPGVASVGEIVADDPRIIASYYGENNDELHMNFYFELINLRFSAGAFRRAVDRWEKILPPDCWPAYALSNHDVPRAGSRYNKGSGGGLIARLMMLMLLTLRGTPFIYYGEEIGLQQGEIPRKELKDPIGVRWYPLHKGRDGCRTPMQWSGLENAGFTTAQPWLPVSGEHKLRNVEAEEKKSDSLLNLTKKVIWFRKTSPALLNGSYRSVKSNLPQNCFVYFRECEQQRLMVALNFSKSTKKLNMRALGEIGTLILTTDGNRLITSIGDILTLQPYEAVIVVLGASDDNVCIHENY